MEEWNAGEYNRESSLQAALAQEQLSRLTLAGTASVMVRVTSAHSDRRGIQELAVGKPCKGER
jgi:hypothetical protein